MASDNTSIINETAAVVVEQKLQEYAADVVTSKYPHPIDGFKQVHRRIVYCAGTRTEKDSFTFLLGDIMKLHPGGDASIYSAIVRLSQTFSVGHPLVKIHGNYGDYTDPGSAGQSRYLEVESAEFARDLFFNNVYQKSIPMMASKDFRLREPIHFIPRVPTALYLTSLTIGYGFKSETPQLNFGSLCDIVMAFAETRKDTMNLYPPYKAVAKYMLPDFPIHGYIRNKNELMQQYHQGNFEAPVRLDGVAELSTSAIRLLNMPYGTIPRTVLERVIASIHNDKTFWIGPYLKDFNNFGGDDFHCDISLEFKNNTKIFHILDQLKKTFQLTDVFYPVYRFVINGRMHHFTPYELIDLWYRARVESILSGIKGKQADLTMDLQKYLSYRVVCEKPDKVIRIVRNAENEDVAVRLLTDAFPALTRMQSRILVNAKLSALTHKSKEDINLSIEKTVNDLEAIRDQYNRVDETIYNDAQFLKKKYPTPRKTIFTDDFTGYVLVDKQGVVQFNDETDLTEILQRFRTNKHVDIQYYLPEFPFKNPTLNWKLISTARGLPREFPCQEMLMSPVREPYTLVYKDGGVAVLDGIKLVKDGNVRSQLITRLFWGIERSGKVIATDIDNYSRKKSVCRGAQNTLMYALPKKCTDYVIVHMNSHHPNEIRFDRILYDGKSGRVVTLMDGETNILAAVPTSMKVVYFGLPAECLNNCATRIIRIENIAQLFTAQATYILELNRVRSNEHSHYIKKHVSIPNALTITLPKQS